MGKRKISNRYKSSIPKGRVKDKNNKVNDAVKNNKDDNPTFNQHLLFLCLHLVLSSIMIYIFYNNPGHIHSESLLIIRNGMDQGTNLKFIEINREVYVEMNAKLNKALSPYIQLWHSNGTKIKPEVFHSVAGIRKLKSVHAGHTPGECFICSWEKISK